MFAKAVASYARRGRIVAAPDRASAVEAVVAGWAADVAEEKETMMYAYRRADVAMLNEAGRQAWRSLGRLGAEELVAPGGTPYAVGDRVVALAPGAGGTVVTSEMGTVVALDAKHSALVVRMDDGVELRRLETEEIADDRLGHAYAVTVHRSQGSTVQRAHALEDGGGRELAYVKMSRARERSTVYVVADDVEQAREDLVREWSAERRPAWVIDSGTPVTDPAAVEASMRVAKPMRDALRRGRLAAERAAIAAVIPPDPIAEVKAAKRAGRRGRALSGRASGPRRLGASPSRDAGGSRAARDRPVRCHQEGPTPVARRAGRRPKAPGSVRAAGCGTDRPEAGPARRRGGAPHRAPCPASRAGHRVREMDRPASRGSKAHRTAGHRDRGPR
jgi:hypothetical protein